MVTQLWAMGLVFVCSIANAFGAIYMKKGAQRFNLNFIRQLRNFPIILGCFLYVISSVLFIAALRGGELSVLYPFSALSYVWVSILSVKLLQEKMNWLKWLGVSLIIIGIAFIGLA